ncbi:MAG: hypothetical protein ABL931_17630 [Usitatibacteraceae bacterium]
MTERISYAHEDGHLAETRPLSLFDRFSGSLLAFSGVSLTLLLGVVILFGGYSKLAIFQHPQFSWNLVAIFFWGSFWIFPATIAGWIGGFDKVLEVLTHVWFTADPPNRRLSRQLWCAIVVACLGAALLASSF